MPEAGTAEPGTDGLSSLLAQLGGGVLYTFTLRPKKETFSLAPQRTEFALRPAEKGIFQIRLQDFWVSTESIN